MSSEVWIVRGDAYHPREVIDPAVARAFAGAEWQIRLTDSARDVLAAAASADLAVFFACGRPPGQPALARGEEEALARQVSAGMGMLRIHAGLVLIEPDSPLQQQLNTGRFVSHPQHDGSVEMLVTYAPLRQAAHPVLADVGPFAGRDEHYWCQVDVTRTDLLLAATSALGTSAAGWAHQVGAGRLVSVTPGHTAAVLMEPGMLTLVANAARWCTRRRAGR